MSKQPAGMAAMPEPASIVCGTMFETTVSTTTCTSYVPGAFGSGRTA